MKKLLLGSLLLAAIVMGISSIAETARENMTDLYGKQSTTRSIES